MGNGNSSSNSPSQEKSLRQIGVEYLNKIITAFPIYVAIIKIFPHFHKRLNNVQLRLLFRKENLGRCELVFPIFLDLDDWWQLQQRASAKNKIDRFKKNI